MGTWEWISVGVGIAFALSLLFGLALAAVLGSISRDVSRVLEGESWVSGPPLRTPVRTRAAAG